MSYSRSSIPSTVIEPSLGSYILASSFTTVDFPDPVAPTSAIRSPGRIRRSSPDTAGAAEPG